MSAALPLLTKIRVWQENICITDDGIVRVTDIGVDTQVRLTNDRYIHSVPSKWIYKSSEELEMNTRTTKTDVYSLAVTIYSVRVLFYFISFMIRQ